MVNRERLYELLNRPYSVTEEEAEFLYELTKKYPFFQAPKAVLLKYFHDKAPERFSRFLPSTAAITSDRTFLYDFINEYTEVPVRKLFKVSTHEEEKQPSIHAGGAGTSQKETIKPGDKKPDGDKREVKLPEKLSYLDWVRFIGTRPAEGLGAKPQRTDLKKRKKMALIDRFLNQQPKIKPSKDYASEPLPEVQASLQENKMLMTETLADLYVKQGKYKKAIQAFEILKLKYPEKNRYFAMRILEVKSLSDQKND